MQSCHVVLPGSGFGARPGHQVEIARRDGPLAFARGQSRVLPFLRADARRVMLVMSKIPGARFARVRGDAILSDQMIWSPADRTWLP
jgi:hypothetical protein